MSKLGSLKYIVFNSLIGEISVVWDNSNDIIKQIVLPDVDSKKFNYGKIQYHGVLQETHPDTFITSVMSDVKDIVIGKDIRFEIEKLDLSTLTDFQKLVLLKQREIPHGKVTTYKKLAELINRPKSARPVANVLASNPFPLLIPCHRTVRSDWSVGGYAGTRNGYFKQYILENEGVQFEKGIAKKEYHYPIENMEVKNML